MPKTPWTRPQRISAAAVGVAAAGILVYVGQLVYGHLAYQDSHSQIEQSKLHDQIESQITKALQPIQSSLQTRESADQTLKQSIDGLKEQLDGIKADSAKTNDLLRAGQQDLAKLNGKVDGIDKNVDLLLEHQLRAASDFPPAVLADQIPNIYFLYQMAAERGVKIPNETNKLIYNKLTSLDSSAPDSWPLRGLIIASAPERPENQEAAERLLLDIRSNAIPAFSPTLVRQIGVAFTQAAIRDQEAWLVALDYAAYRTELNTSLLGAGWQAIGDAISIQVTGLVSPGSIEPFPAPGHLLPEVFLREPVPPMQAFHFFKIGTKDPHSEGPQNLDDGRDIRIDFGTVKLDNLDLRNVWFVNSMIRYAGEPIKANGVTFVHCKFAMPNAPRTRSVIASVLEAGRLNITFN